MCCPRSAGKFSNRYQCLGIVLASPSVSISVSDNNAFLDRKTYRSTQPEPVRWWIPLVASTGALLALVFGAAAMIGGFVNSTIGSIG